MIVEYTYRRWNGRISKGKRIVSGSGKGWLSGKRRPWRAGRLKGDRGHCGGCGEVGHNALTCPAQKRIRAGYTATLDFGEAGR